MEVNRHQEISLCGSKANQVGVGGVRGREKLQSSLVVGFVAKGFQLVLGRMALRRMRKHQSMDSKWRIFNTLSKNRFFASLIDDRMEN